MNIRSLEIDQKKAFIDLLNYYEIHAEPYRMMKGQVIVTQVKQDELLSDLRYLKTMTYHGIPLQKLNSEYRRIQE